MTLFMSISQAPINGPHTITRCLIYGNKQSSLSSWALHGLRDLIELPVSCQGEGRDWPKRNQAESRAQQKQFKKWMSS